MDKEKDGVNKSRANENTYKDIKDSKEENIIEIEESDKAISQKASEINDIDENNKITEDDDKSKYEIIDSEIINIEKVSENEDIQEKTKKFTKKHMIIVGTCIGAILIIGFVANNVAKKYHKIVYPGAILYENNISKLDNESLNKKINEIKNNLGKNKINIQAKDKKYSIDYNDLIEDYNDDELKTEVMSYGKEGNTLKQFGIITIGINRNYKFDIKVNEKSLEDLVNKVYEENSEEPIEPSISINGTNIDVKEGKNSMVVDREKLKEEIKFIIENYDGNDEEVEISANYIEEEPKINIEDLKKVDTKISVATTQYGTGGGRGKNVEVATSKVDDLLLMPGEEFSYENAVGPVTQENGYTYAPVISNGELVQGIGGGVCQVSSTIYNAELKAGILPTERRNHSKPVSYLPRGLDATLASGSIDYKFKNTYEYPLVINTYTSGGTIYIEFWSNKNATKGIRYEAVSYVRGKVADTYLYGYDSNKNRVYEKYIDTSVYR